MRTISVKHCTEFRLHCFSSYAEILSVLIALGSEILCLMLNFSSVINGNPHHDKEYEKDIIVKCDIETTQEVELEFAQRVALQ